MFKNWHFLEISTATLFNKSHQNTTLEINQCQLKILMSTIFLEKNQTIIIVDMKIVPYYIHLCQMIVNMMVQPHNTTQRNYFSGYVKTLT